MLIGADITHTNFGFSEPENDSLILESPFGLLRASPYPKDNSIILLGVQDTLYKYELSVLKKFYKGLNTSWIMILCDGLRSARGSGERKWINTQHGESNFNVNLLGVIPRVVNTWALQERIAKSIIETLDHFSEEMAGITYPFHYTIQGGKIAGHLVQCSTFGEQTFMRIGLGINTSEKQVKLPENDELRQHLYSHPRTLKIGKKQWIEIACFFRERIIKNIGMDAHQFYTNKLNIRSGEAVIVYEDSGGIQFGKKIQEGFFWGVKGNGEVYVEDVNISGKDVHIMKVEQAGRKNEGIQGI